MVPLAKGATRSRLSSSRSAARTKSGVSGGIQRGAGVTVDDGEANVATGTADTIVVVWVSITAAAGASSISNAGPERGGRATVLSTMSAKIEPSAAETMMTSERRRLLASRSSG